MRKLIVFSLLLATPLFAYDRSWYERASHQLDKKVTVELVDTKLSEAMSFLSQLTGLNIIINPKVMATNPTVNLRVKDMDAGNYIKWITRLTDTYADVVDQAIYITDKPSEDSVEEEKTDLMLLAASMHTEIELPPKGQELTDADRVKIALKLIEKMDVKPTDFPGPDLSIGAKSTEPVVNPFAPKN